MTLIEAAVEMDDEAMEAYLDGKEPDEPTSEAPASARRVISIAFVPVLCGSAFKNKGVQPLLDAVVDYLPSPLDRERDQGHQLGDRRGRSCASPSTTSRSRLAFKIMNDPFVGSLTFCRIYSGTLESGHDVLNTTKDKNERVGRMLLMHANNREEIKEAYAGDIVALAGLKDTRTGDTLCDPEKPIILEKMEFPDPVIEMAVEPKTKADQEKMASRCAMLAAKIRPSASRPIRKRPDHHQGHGRTASRNQGRHLCGATYKVEANVGAPQVAYRETLTKRIEIDYTHKKQSGGSGQFARVKIVFEPTETGHGHRLREPSRRRLGAEGIHSGRRQGPQVGHGIRRARRLPDHRLQGDPDRRRLSRRRLSALAFEIAARAAFREGLQKAGSVLLEPIMKVEVVTPEEYMGDVIGDLNCRRGQIQGQDMRGNALVVDAMVPLANMFGYVNQLRSMCARPREFTMEFDHYEQVPRNVAEEIKAKYA